MCVRRAEPLCEREGGPRAEPHASPTTAEKAVSYAPDRCLDANPDRSPFPPDGRKGRRPTSFRGSVGRPCHPRRMNLHGGRRGSAA